MITLNPDPDDLPRWISATAEHCCFCGAATRTWHAPSDVAICTRCAETREPHEVPGKEEWCASAQGRGEMPTATRPAEGKT